MWKIVFEASSSENDIWSCFFTQLQMIQRTTDNIVTERFPWWLFNFLCRIHISTFDNWQLRWRTSYLLNQQTGRRMITENLKAINVWALALLKQHWILYDWLTRCVAAALLDSQCNWLTILELWSQLHCSSYQLREGWWVLRPTFSFLPSLGLRLRQEEKQTRTSWRLELQWHLHKLMMTPWTLQWKRMGAAGDHAVV